MKLADRIKEERLRLGLSQTELGARFDAKQQIVDKLERGHIKNPRNIKQIAAALETTPEYLLFGKRDDISYSLRFPIIKWEEAGNRDLATLIKTINLPDDYYTLIVNDDNMTTGKDAPSFPTGTLLIVKPAKTADIDNLVIIRYAGKNFFRKLIDTGKHLRFAALNANADWFLLDEAEIIGVVVASLNVNL